MRFYRGQQHELRQIYTVRQGAPEAVYRCASAGSVDCIAKLIQGKEKG